jgi:hypothetical protein
MARGTWQGGGTWQTSGGGGLVLVIIVAALAVGSGAVTAAVHALEVAVIVLGAVIGLAVLGGVALLVYRARSDRPQAASERVPRADVPSAQRPELSANHKPAIEPPQLHLHIDGADPEVIAAIMRHLSRE